MINIFCSFCGVCKIHNIFNACQWCWPETEIATEICYLGVHNTLPSIGGADYNAQAVPTEYRMSLRRQTFTSRYVAEQYWIPFFDFFYFLRTQQLTHITMSWDPCESNVFSSKDHITFENNLLNALIFIAE